MTSNEPVNSIEALAWHPFHNTVTFVDDHGRTERLVCLTCKRELYAAPDIQRTCDQPTQPGSQN